MKYFNDDLELAASILGYANGDSFLRTECNIFDPKQVKERDRLDISFLLALGEDLRQYGYGYIDEETFYNSSAWVV